MKIFIIKTQNYGSDTVDTLCAYDNEESAKKHIEAFKDIYKGLKSNIWYESMFMKSDFNLQE